jgi:hypothetical protein
MTPLERVVTRFAADDIIDTGGGTFRARCAGHHGTKFSLAVAGGKNGRVLFFCHSRQCPVEVIVAALGLEMSDLFVAGSRDPGTGSRGGGTETVFEIRGAGGTVEARHVRVDRPDGTKQVFWQRPDGQNGLGGMKVTDLPLYGTPELVAAPASATVVVTEGEKARDALTARGVLSVGTVTGAEKTPCDAQLEFLRGHDVVLWPDHDGVGHKHMRRIAVRLSELGIGHRWVSWPEATLKEDAADFAGDDVALSELIAAAGSVPPETEDPPDSAAGERTKAGSSNREVVLTNASDIAPEPVGWAWKGRVPLDGVTLLVGDPGFGKSTLAIDLIARASRGTLEGDLFGVPVNCALVTAEDAIAQVVRPRLEAAGADLYRIKIVSIRHGDMTDGITLPDDIPALRDTLRDADVRWLIVDPMVSFLPTTVDAHKDQHVRRVMAPLQQLAEELHLAVVGIIHLNKRTDTQAVVRVSGSIGFVAAARSVLLFGQDPGAPDGPTRCLLHWKCNVGAKQPGVRVKLEGRWVQADGKLIETSGIVWAGADFDSKASSVSPHDVLGEKAVDASPALEEAMDAIRAILAVGPVAATTCEKQLKQAGIATRTWKRAKAALGVRSKKRGLDSWEWVLDRRVPETPRHENVAPLAPFSTDEPTDPAAEREGRQKSGTDSEKPAPNGVKGAKGAKNLSPEGFGTLRPDATAGGTPAPPGGAVASNGHDAGGTSVRTVSPHDPCPGCGASAWEVWRDGAMRRCGKCAAVYPANSDPNDAAPDPDEELFE